MKADFYLDHPDSRLRQGDVVSGLPTVQARMGEEAIASAVHSYKLDIEVPGYCVVLTPCCSIEGGLVTVTPLIQVPAGPLKKLLKNPFFAEDLTRINRRIKPQESLPPGEWAALTAQEQGRRLEQGVAYAFLNYFIYAEHALLPAYERRSQKLGYHMIDFTESYSIAWTKIQRDKDAPKEIKRLQLTVGVRYELREKLTAYYDRIPEEDEALVG